MSGTIAGGRKAAETNKAKYGEDFYEVQGRKGGSSKHNSPRGFAYSKANGLTVHIEAGRKGGTISRRRPKSENNS